MGLNGKCIIFTNNILVHNCLLVTIATNHQNKYTILAE